MYPRLLLLAFLAVLPALPAFAGSTEVAPMDLPPLRLVGDPVAPAVQVSTEARLALEKTGWKVQRDGALERAEGGPDRGLIPKEYLEKGGLEWRDGALYYKSSPYKVENPQLGLVLRGLWTFTDAARPKRREAAIRLAAWGLPPEVDGRRLYNPNGETTYYGQMLHLLLAAKPDQVATLGVQRTSQALDLINEAFTQAFSKQSADIAQTSLDRAKAILYMPARAGETPLVPGGAKARPDPAASLAEYRKQLQADIASAEKAGDAARRKDSAEALAVLNNLEKQRFYKYQDLPVVPPVPGKDVKPGDGKTAGPAGSCGLISCKDDKEPYAALASGLPALLRTLDRVGGAPLTSEQQESVIRSFPMGDLVWRMGAQELWKQGLTGKGVKVAVIDQGIAEHPELDGVVKSRDNFTPQRGAAAVGSHATHVSGIIHALAPDAELRGYAVFGGDESNGKLRENPETAIIAAIKKAVADGNQIVNMSLGGGSSPGGEMQRLIEEYSRKGTIFIIAAGNSRDASGGIDAPSSSPSAITVGALDSAGRMADFSSFGDRFDPRKLTTVVKEVFMTPGSNIVSTMPNPSFSFGKPEPQYAAMSGTSMATPALAGVSALLVQDMVPNPVSMAERLKTALRAGGEPIAMDKLPPEIPVDQPFIVVNPVKALEALRRTEVPVAAKSPDGRTRMAEVKSGTVVR